MGEDGDLADRAVVVIADCAPKADGAESAVDIVFCRKDIEVLNGGKLFGDVFSGDGITLCKAKERNEFGEPDNGAVEKTTEPGEKNLRIL